MAKSGLIELYDPKDYLCGEVILVQARKLHYDQLQVGEHTTARPCCRITATSRDSNSEAVVTKEARVDHKGRTVDGSIPQGLREMMGKILLGNVLVLEGEKHGKEVLLPKTGSHRGKRNEMKGNSTDLAFAIIDQPAKVHSYKENREKGSRK